MKYFFLCLWKELYGFSFIVCWYGELHWLFSLNQAYSHREGNGTPLQYSCLENPMDRGAWWAAIHGVSNSRTQLSDLTWLTFSFSVVSNSLQPHGMHHTRPLSTTNSWKLLKLMSIELVMPPNHVILCRPFLLKPSNFTSIRIFSNQSVFCIRWQNIGVSTSTSLLPMNTQDWFPLGWTGWISVQSKGL